MLVAGYAKVPAMSGVHGTHDHFTVSLVIDTMGDRSAVKEETLANPEVLDFFARLRP